MLKCRECLRPRSLRSEESKQMELGECGGNETSQTDWGREAGARKGLEVTGPMGRQVHMRKLEA